ncbi:MAG: diaminopimelate epimerase [Paludibacteraceae bacterium]|nr:diaminopimelate epimerase [Paludibacteraceae bacterium]
MKTLPFIKMHGLGNDYVFVDCFLPQTAALMAKTDLSALARRISDRHCGVGSDGLVLILPAQEADARMRMFNADGSEAQMCGNAIRCVAKYLYESGLCNKSRLFVDTLAGIRILSLHVNDGHVDQVTVNMGVPSIKPDVLTPNTDPLGFMAVNMGNPHAVFFRDTVITSEQLGKEGERIGTHPHFPEGTNVEFVCVRNDKELDLRVWERGTGETQACGTGACAAVAAAIKLGKMQRSVTVHLPGGDLLIQWEANDKPVFMTGSATEVFRGEYRL